MSVVTNGEQTAKQTANGTPLRTLEEHLAWVATLAAARADLHPLVEVLLREKFQLQGSLEEVRAHQEILREQIQALCAPECYPAVITGVHPGGAANVEVAAGGARLRVAVHPDVDPERLRVGARGILTKARNCLLEVDGENGDWADVGTFEDYLPDRGRMLLRYQEQLVAVAPSDGLAGAELRKGDLVGFDRDGARLAYVKVDPPGRQDLFFEDTPADRFEELGGLDEEIAQLKRVVQFRLRHEELARRYRLKAKRGILLEGPPGNGKTKLARCLARFVADLVPAGACRFMAIAGSSDYSMWLGQSEQRLIARFEAARALASDSQVPVVMFFDEIDAIGRRRGSDLGGAAPDRILATLLAQLDGVQQVGNLIVVGATNRADILDPGLIRPGRLGDFKLRIPAPNRAAAGAILNCYLAGLPLVGEAGRLVNSLLSRVYSDKGEYAELARVTLRDGRKVEVRGRDLVSGAVLENVVRLAAEDAADREARTGEGGVSEEDLAGALDRELRGAAALLTPANVRGHVHRLPQDVDPVAVEVPQRGPGVGRYAAGPEQMATEPQRHRGHSDDTGRVTSAVGVPAGLSVDLSRSDSMEPCIKVLGADFELANAVEGDGPPGHNAWEAARRLLDEIPGYPRGGGWGGTAIEWGRRFLPGSGGSAYIDSDHLEINLPEHTRAADHAAHMHAGFRIAQRAREAAMAGRPGGRRINVLASVSDGHRSWGHHLNVMVRRQLFDDLFTRKPHLAGFFATHLATASLYTGQGQAGPGNGRPACDYQLAQRPDWFEELVGTQTMYNRPLLNMRDEPHAGDGLARMHIIYFDNVLCPVANYLKAGATQLVLALLEAGWADPGLTLDDPLEAGWEVSRDLTLRRPLRLAGRGRSMTAVEVQRALADLAGEFVASGQARDCVPGAEEIVACWRETLDMLGRGDLAALARRLDWALKFILLERQRARRGLSWQSAEIKCLDLRYASLDPQEGLFLQLAAAGQVEAMPTHERIERFVNEPPDETRAYLRAHVLRRLGEQVVDMDWDRIRFRVYGERYWSPEVWLGMPDPAGFGREASQALLEQCGTARDLVETAGTVVPASRCRHEVGWAREPWDRRGGSYPAPLPRGW